MTEPSAFMRAMGLVVERASGEEVIGHVEASGEHHTPFGRVHGGVYAAVIEAACSTGATLAVLPDGRYAVGLSNHTDFLRSHTEGRLDVRAFPVHQGRSGQLWQCDVTRNDGDLVAQGRVRLHHLPLEAKARA